MQRQQFRRRVFLTVTKIVCLLGFTYGVIVQIALQRKSLSASIIMMVCMGLLIALHYYQPGYRGLKLESPLRSVKYPQYTGERPTFLAFLFGRFLIGMMAVFVSIVLFVVLNGTKVDPWVLTSGIITEVILALAVCRWIYEKSYPRK